LENSLNQGTDSNVLQTEESGHDQEMRHFLNRPVHMEPAEAYA